jgi:hypothetical protein
MTVLLPYREVASIEQPLCKAGLNIDRAYGQLTNCPSLRASQSSVSCGYVPESNLLTDVGRHFFLQSDNTVAFRNTAPLLTVHRDCFGRAMVFICDKVLFCAGYLLRLCLHEA